MHFSLLVLINIDDKVVTHWQGRVSSSTSFGSLHSILLKLKLIKEIYNPKDYSFEFVNFVSDVQRIEYEQWALVKLSDIQFFDPSSPNAKELNLEIILRFVKTFGSLEADSFIIEKLTSGQKFQSQSIYRNEEVQNFHQSIDELIREKFDKEKHFTLDDYLFKYYSSSSYSKSVTLSIRHQNVKIFFPKAYLLCKLIDSHSSEDDEEDSTENLYYDICAPLQPDREHDIKHSHKYFEYSSLVQVDITHKIQTLLESCLKKFIRSLPTEVDKNHESLKTENFILKWRHKRQYLNSNRTFDQDKLLREMWNSGGTPELTLVLKTTQFPENVLERIAARRDRNIGQIGQDVPKIKLAKNESLDDHEIDLLSNSASEKGAILRKNNSQNNNQESKSERSENSEQLIFESIINTDRSQSLNSETENELCDYGFALYHFLDPLFYTRLVKKNLKSSEVEIFQVNSFAKDYYFDDCTDLSRRADVFLKCALFVSDIQISKTKSFLLPHNMVFAHIHEKDELYRESLNLNGTLRIKLVSQTYPLPISTKLCISILYASKDKLEKGHKMPLFWANLNIFESQGTLKNEKIFLNLWPVDQAFVSKCHSKKGNQEEVFFPLDMTGSAPDNQITVELLIKLNEPYLFQKPLSTNEMIEKSLFYTEPDNSHISKDDEIKLKLCLDKFWCVSVSEQASISEYIWRNRCYIVMTWPDFLPIVLRIMPLKSKGTFYLKEALLQGCPNDLDPVTALALFGPFQHDKTAQEIAIRVLNNLDDSMVEIYLLHIVQCLKYQVHYHNPLAIFLFRRATKNNHIAVKLYNYLRAETEFPTVSTRFAVYLKELLRFLDESLISTLFIHTKLTEILTFNHHNNTRDTKFLKSPDMRALIHGVPSPLAQDIILWEANLDGCRRMNSSKAPWNLSWFVEPDHIILTNSNNLEIINKKYLSTEPTAKYEFLFKAEDDLRQDCFVTHMFRIMEQYWLEANLPFRFDHYDVLPCPSNTGYIETVKDSVTMRYIRTMPISRSTNNRIMLWLEENNSGKELQRSIDRFAVTLVAYTVGTYILGVGDRHSSNIMVGRNGHFFHIDFGHILGDKKEDIIYIKRDKAAIVVIDAFIEIFNKSSLSKKYAIYGLANLNEILKRKIFIDCCLDAYMIQRTKADKIVNLIILAMGGKLKNINQGALSHLKEVLQLGQSEETAREHFLKTINESIKLQQTTINWWKNHENARSAIRKLNIR